MNRNIPGFSEPIPGDHQAVIEALEAHGGWIVRSRLTRLCGIPDRRLRRVAELTGDIVTGQKGYKLTDLATQDEIRHARASLLSRIDKHSRRAALLERKLTPMIGDLFPVEACG